MPVGKMTSTRPYLVRAMHAWIVDNGLTPYLMVDAGREGVQVPAEYVQDGKIVLNVSPAAVKGLELTNDRITFNARFGGRPLNIQFPVSAVQAVYARENGRGMVFSEDEPGGGDEPPSGPTDKGPQKPSLRLVK